MRLINTESLVLSEFFGSNIPPYAILSHTWGQEEISFQEWMAWQTESDPVRSQKEGFIKIKGACRQARHDKLEWLWVDTNCIDKTSSSELTEAINSMYTWYRDAVVCYAYLADVPPLRKHDPDHLKSFRASRWHTRGWTLQELLAPKRLEFYSNTWSRLGSKSASLIRAIHESTGIELSYLSGHVDIRKASVAKKMSWLSKRTTTRTEDIAYCMLGIFDINMPLLYGEGMQAFTRLQNEIVRHVYDHTIFCWAWDYHVPSDWVSMLAPSPRVFRKSGDYIQRERYENLTHYSTTNLGLLIALPALYTLGSRLLVVLDAGLSRYSAGTRVCIPLRRPSELGMVFERVHFPPKPMSIHLVTPYLQARYSLYALNKPTPSALKSRSNEMPSKYGVLLLVEPTASQFIEAVGGFSPGLPADRPLKIRRCQFSTYPPRMFDESRDVFFVPLSAHTGTPRYSLTLEVTVDKPDDRYTTEEDYYLFIAITSSKKNPQWHCSITTRSKLYRDKRWNTSNSCDPENVDRYFHEKYANIWDSGPCCQSYQSSDQLHVSLGRRLNIHPDLAARWCVLSRNKELSIGSYGSDDEDRGGDSDDSTRAQARQN